MSGAEEPLVSTARTCKIGEWVDRESHKLVEKESRQWERRVAMAWKKNGAIHFVDRSIVGSRPTSMG
jgi:hypothetical protein